MTQASRLHRFAARCKFRHDYGDMIQVRYSHPNGEHFDTWVSGEEVDRRLRSMAAEERLRALRKFDLRALRQARDHLENEGKRRLRREMRDRLADSVEDFLGDGMIGESLSETVRGPQSGENQDEKSRWNQKLREDAFRAVVLDLAWIQLEGSFPDNGGEPGLDDWLP